MVTPNAIYTAFFVTIPSCFTLKYVASTKRDRQGTFEPIVVEKGQKDISSIEEKIIRMYARDHKKAFS